MCRTIICLIVHCSPTYSHIGKSSVMTKVKNVKFRTKNSYETGLVISVFENKQYCKSEYKA